MRARLMRRIVDWAEAPADRARLAHAAGDDRLALEWWDVAELRMRVLRRLVYLHPRAAGQRIREHGYGLEP